MGGGGSNSDGDQTVTITFSAEPETILRGESATLTWETSNADTVTIDNGIGDVDVDGSTVVYPVETTTYTLTATGTGETSTSCVTVTVNYQPTVSLSASSTSIYTGESAVLSWTSTHADSCVIEPSIGTVETTGSITVTPAVTTTYTITATGTGRTAEATVKVTVGDPNVPIISLDTGVINITRGQSAALSWASIGGRTAYIDNGVGTVSTDGIISVTPEHTTIYTLTVIGNNGTASAKIYVYVAGYPILPSEGFWGYTYLSKVPADSTVEVYDENRFAMVVGEVVDMDGQPIEGVLAHIHDHLEYGTCATSADGRFSLPVNGGGLMTVVYEKEGFITSHRQVHTPWKDFVIADTVTMIEEDSAETTVVFDGNANTVYTHKSTTISDDRGSRSTTLVFTGDNQAYLVDENGNDVKLLNTITVRATEYTTPESMPAALPATSAFTYCSELSVDGAARVRFAKPVVTWVDNFIGFEVGDAVPVGTYDRDRGLWIAEENGVVVKLLDTDNDGIVDALDADGDDLKDDLDSDSNYADEVKGLEDSSKFIAGNTYWRSEVSHFSPWDWNWLWCWLFPNDMDIPLSNDPVVDKQCDEKDCKGLVNSYVQEKSRVYHEDIAIPGTGMTMHYSSNRAKEYMRSISVPVSGDTVPASTRKIVVKMEVAGQTYTQTLDALPNQVAQFAWDGRDLYSRGYNYARAKISIGYECLTTYVRYSSGSNRRLFGKLYRGPQFLPVIPKPMYQTKWETRSKMIKGSKISQLPDVQSDKPAIAQGWEFSTHHWLDQINDPYTLYKGNGERINHIISDYKLGYLDIASVVTPFAGNATSGCSGDGGPAIDAQLEYPEGLAVDAQGNIYIADSVCNCIRKVDAEGIVTTVAGNGAAGYSGDGGPATEAMLNGPKNIVVDNKGNIFITDFWNNRVRKVDTEGIITTVAGNGDWGSSGDEGLATEASLIPNDLALDSSGNLYIADYHSESVGGGIRRVDSEGYISTLPINEILTDYYPYCEPLSIAFDAEDNLYFLHNWLNVVYKVDRGGSILEVIAGGGSSSDGDGYPATDVSLDSPTKITLDASGNIYILESCDRIRKVNTNGIITTVAGQGAPGLNENGEPLNNTSLLNGLSGVAVNPDGELFVSYGANAVVGKVGPFVPYFNLDSAGGKVFVEDNGVGHLIDEITGLHLKTVDMNTGVVLREFGYDNDRNLTTITDQFGNQTEIQRDGDGLPTAIVSPEGLITSLSLDSDNNLTRITYPDGSHYDFEYTSGGLMTAEIEPNGNRFEHVFNDAGRIARVLDQEGGNWRYDRQFVADSGNVDVNVTTGEGNVTNYQENTDTAGVYNSTITDPTGAETTFTRSKDGMTASKSLACGMQLDFEYGIDTEHRNKYLTKSTQNTPDGLERITEFNRAYQDTDYDNVTDLITKTTSQNGKTTTTVQSVAASQKVTTSPEGRTVTLQYDPTTLTTQSVSIPGLNQTEYGYDSQGRLTSKTTGSREVSYTYDTNGFVDSITDPESKTTTYTNDVMGRITGVSRPDGGTLGFTYDDNGNMTILTNPSDIDHTHTFNGVNLPDSYETPLSGSYQYFYDADRRLITTTFPSGKEINNIYTTTQLTQVQTPEGNIDYTYVCTDLVDTVSKGSESIAYTYDGSLPTSMTYSGTLNQGLSYTYNNDFFVNSVSYAGATESYAYDQDNMLTGAGDYTITRNAQNGLAEAVSGGSLNIDRTFNGYGEISNQTVSVNGSSAINWTLTRDNAGRITSKTETVNGVTANYIYAYDSMGRLETVTKDSSVVESYGYDLNGTRISETNTLRGITRTLSYNDEDHLLTAGSATYTYDLDGFLTGKADGADSTIYDYSSRGELLQVNLPNGDVITYDHDPLGRRIAKRINGTITEKYLWQSLTTLLAIYDGSDNLVQRFEYADGRMPVSMTQGGTTYYFAYDQVGSLRVVTDSAGNVIKQVDYDAFGNILADSNSAFTVPFGFAGGLHDRDTGLVRFGYRDYDTDTGRWTAKDPIGFAGGDTDLFGYVQNDPVNFIDPTGEFQNHYQNISINRSKGEIHHNGSLYAYTGSDGNWHEFTMELSGGKTWPGGLNSADVVAQELVDRLNREDWIDAGLSGASVCAATASALTTGGTSWALWGAGAALDAASYARSGDVTQLIPSTVGLPALGKAGGVLGVGGATANFVRSHP